MKHPHPSARRRAVVALGVGLAAGIAVAVVGAVWQVFVLVGWDVGALFTIVWVALEVRGHDAEGTAELATREDDSRFAADALLVGASLTSLVGVAFGLIKISQSEGLAQAGMTA